MTIHGVDYSWQAPDPACLAREGYRFVVRYIGGGSESKQLQSDELAELRAAGLAVAVTYQVGTRTMTKGDHAGQIAARRCLADLDQLGVTAPVPVYHALDTDPAGLNRHAWRRVRGYLGGVAKVMGRGRVGIYGGYEAVRRAQLNGWAPWGWQTYAWSRGQWWPGAQLRQTRNHVETCGGTVDLCEATTARFGQWPDPTTGEDDMDVRMLLTDGTRLACTDWTDTAVYDPDTEAGEMLRYLWDGPDPVECTPEVIDGLIGASDGLRF